MFRIKIALTTHDHSLKRKHLENTEDYILNCIKSMREFHVTDKYENFIIDIDEAIK